MRNLPVWMLAIASACTYSVPRNHDCVETPGYCTFNEYCDSDTRRCTLTCTAKPPRICPPGTQCDYSNGKCRAECPVKYADKELRCDDGVDDDCNGRSDCSEAVCEGQTCGHDCVCKGGVRVELNCSNGLDDDFDSRVDCADDECAGKGCLKNEKVGTCVDFACQ